MFKNSQGQLVTAEEAAADLNAQLDAAEAALQLEKYKSPLDERAAFEAHESKERRLSQEDQRTWFRRGAIADYDCKAIDDAWKAWQARAALEQHSPAQELEHPEVVAWSAERYVAGDHYSKPRLSFEQPFSTDRNIEPLMTVAQHAGIVAKWVSLFNRAQDRADAALSRLAELEQQDPIYQMRPSDNVREWCDIHPDGYRAAKAMASLETRVVYARPVPVAQAGQVPEGMPDLCRLLAKLYCELDELRYQTARLPADEIADAMLFKWPVLQGTRNQLNIKRISEQPYDESKLQSGVAALLAAAPGCTEEPFPSPQKQSKPCGECRLPEGERCDICGAQQS